MAIVSEPAPPGLRDLVEIGRGGFGVVYRARQDGLDRDVAVKFLTARRDEAARARFAQECRALGQLSGHPHIVGVHDGGVRPDGQAFLVMPFYPAGALSGRLGRSGPLPWPEVLDIGVRLSGALQTAHDAGILHRDLKPANILIDQYGAPRLGDFGQARLADAEETRTGEMAITPNYAAPEIVNGAASTVQSDVYALAATAMTLLLGHPPFDTGGDLVAMLYRVMSEPPPDLRWRGVPDPLAAVLEQAMAKDPSRRFESAAHFGMALQGAQARLGLHRSPLSVAGRPASALPPVAIVQTDPALRASSAHTGLTSLGHPLATAMGPGPASVGQLTGRSAPAAPARRGRPWVAAAAVLAIVLALGGVTYAVLRLAEGGSGSPPAAGQSTGAAPSTTTDPGTSPPSATPTTPRPSFGPTGVPAADGVADVTAVSGDPAAEDVATTLSAYFTG